MLSSCSSILTESSTSCWLFGRSQGHCLRRGRRIDRVLTGQAKKVFSSSPCIPSTPAWGLYTSGDCRVGGCWKCFFISDAKETEAPLSPHLLLTRGIYFGSGGLDSIFYVPPAVKRQFQWCPCCTQSLQAGAPARRQHYFCDCTGSVVSLRVPIYKTYQSVKWGTGVKNWMALSSLSWKQSAAH